MALFFSSLMDNMHVISTVVGVGGVVVFLLFSYYGKGLRRLLRCRRRRPPVLRGVSVSTQPAIALKKAVDHIARGEIATLGELLHFFRGRNNEKVIRLDNDFHAYLQRIFGAVSPEAKIFFEFGCGRAREMLRQFYRCAEGAARLEKERATPFSADDAEHVRLLRELWRAAGKSSAQFAQRSEEWGELGFQGTDPATDLRGGGVLALRQFLHFAQTHADDFREMMAFNKETLAAGEHSWYLLAVVSIQFTAQLLLQQDHKIYLPQLEVLYDTIKVGRDGGESDEDSTRCVGVLRPAVLERRGGGKEGGCGELTAPAVWGEESDFEAGFHALHHQLLLHFKRCWHRDLPHVMEYGNYVPTVFQSFFVPE